MAEPVKEFWLGQKVKLNSGSPILTVVDVVDDTTIIVKWMDGPHVEAHVFPSACLTAV